MKKKKINVTLDNLAAITKIFDFYGVENIPFYILDFIWENRLAILDIDLSESEDYITFQGFYIFNEFEEFGNGRYILRYQNSQEFHNFTKYRGMSVLKYITQKEIFIWRKRLTNVFVKLVRSCVETGNFEMYEYLINYYQNNVTSVCYWYMDSFCDGKDQVAIKFFNFFVEKKLDINYSKIIEFLIKQDNIICIKYLLKHHKHIFDQKKYKDEDARIIDINVDQSILFCKFEILKLFASYGGVPYNYYCIGDGPVKEGNIEMLDYIYEELDFKNNEIMTKEIDPNIEIIWEEHPFYSFIVSGKIEVVKWFCKRYKFKDKFPLSFTAYRGNLEIFKYLHKKGYPFDENLIIGNAMKGFHLNIIKYCLKKGMNFDREVYFERYVDEE